MKFLKNCLLLILISVLLASCATIVSQTDYDVSITSNPSDSYITITDRYGYNVYSGSTPAYVNLLSHDDYFVGARYTVNFEKDGYQTQTMLLKSHVDPWYFGNLFLYPLIPVTMLIIDPFTGAMWRLPPSIHGQMYGGINSVNPDSLNIEFSSNENPPETTDQPLMPFE
jgi:hypothetical protein